MFFEFATTQRIIFGPGKIDELPTLAAQMGTRAALITGSCAERILPIFKLLKNANANPAAFSITAEPTTTRIAAMAQKARELNCDYVVAFGGGSVIDAGKAIAALLSNTKELSDYLEVIGKGEPLENDPSPCIAIPTTAGTGAEVTRNAVILSPEHNIKVSIRHPKMLPTVALIDPTLTCSMPPDITASTGLDAFTQLLEAFVSCKANPLSDALCREGLKLAARSLATAYTEGNNLEARTEMALASLFSGLALANAGLGAVHGFAGPIGGMFKASHGTICAALLPAVTTINIKALKERAPEHAALEKYREAATIITNNLNADPDEMVKWIQHLCRQLKIPRLNALGINEHNIQDIVENGKKASSMKGNPIVLLEDELVEIIAASL